MPVTIPCSCGNWLSAENQPAGALLRCPVCRKEQRVPGAADKGTDKSSQTSALPGWLDGLRSGEQAGKRPKPEQLQAAPLPNWLGDIRKAEHTGTTSWIAALPQGRMKSFLEAVRDNHLLKSEHLDKIGQDVLIQQDDPKLLAEQLIERQWLTRYQADQLLEGHGQDLAIGPYCLLDPLGGGGMGQVFRARHQSTNQLAAVKVLRKDRLENPDAVRRFCREIQNTIQLRHPNIVRALDSNEVDNKLFLAMEFVDGIDLSRMVKESGPLPIDQACDYVRQAALGLQYAHEHGLAHRDVKPANLMVTRTTSPGAVPTVKMLDLGLARLQGDTSRETDLTRSGRLLGTPDYMAPEQARNSHEADIRSDLYSLGCTFFFLLTGRPPFIGNSVTDLILIHMTEEPPSIRTFRPEVAPAIESIIARLLAKRPDARYREPVELVQALLPFCPAGSCSGAGHQAITARAKATAVAFPVATVLEPEPKPRPHSDPPLIAPASSWPASQGPRAPSQAAPRGESVLRRPTVKKYGASFWIWFTIGLLLHLVGLTMLIIALSRQSHE